MCFLHLFTQNASGGVGGWDEYVYTGEWEDPSKYEQTQKINDTLANDIHLKEFFRKLKEKAEEDMLLDLSTLVVFSSQVGR